MKSTLISIVMLACTLMPALSQETSHVVEGGWINSQDLAAYESLAGQARREASYRIGEAKIDRHAATSGWKKLYPTTVSRLGQQGIDRVYVTASGRLIIVEAKGPGGQFDVVAGHRQGTPAYNVHRVASHMAKQDAILARRLLEGLAKGEVDSMVSTISRNGRWTLATHPTCKDAARMATEALKRLQAAPVVRVQPVDGLDDAARGAGRMGKAVQMGGKIVGRAAPVVGVGIELGRAVVEAKEIEEHYEKGDISETTRVEEHAGNVGQVVGGLSAAGAGSLGGLKAGAAIGSFGGPIGTAIGGGVGAVVGGVSGYIAGSGIGRELGKGVTRLWNGLFGDD